MGKMGDAASLGAVAIAGILLLKILGMPKLELPKLPGFEWTFIAPDPYLPRARDLYDIPPLTDDTLMIDVDPWIPAVPDTKIYDAAREAFEIAAEHERRLAASRAAAETSLADLESQLAALGESTARLSSLVGGNGNADVDAGGSTDMDSSLTDVYWRTGMPRPI